MEKFFYIIFYPMKIYVFLKIKNMYFKIRKINIEVIFMKLKKFLLKNLGFLRILFSRIKKMYFKIRKLILKLFL